MLEISSYTRIGVAFVPFMIGLVLEKDELVSFVIGTIVA